MAEQIEQVARTAGRTFNISLAELAGANAGQRNDLLALNQAVYRVPDGTLYTSTGSQLVLAQGLPVTASTNPLTGGIEYSVQDEQLRAEAINARASGRNALVRSGANSIAEGIKIVDMATVTVTVATAAQRIACNLAKSNSVLRLLRGANADLDGMLYSTPATEFAIGFWAYKPTNTARSNLAMYVTSGNFTNYAKCNICIEPGLHYYAIPRLNLDQFGTGLPPGTTINKIRFRDLADAGDYPIMEDGTDILIGDIFLVSSATVRPKFVWSFDDCKENLAVPIGDPIVGGNSIAQQHSFASFVESYNWRGTAYVIGGLLNRSGFSTVTQLRAMQDNGWTIGTHSWSHPNSGDASPTVYGLRNLGPQGYAALLTPYQFTAAYTGAILTARNDSKAIREDVERGMAVCYAAGFEGYRHFCTPQAGTDFYVQEALRACGVLSVRGARPTVFSETKYALANGAISGSVRTNATMVTAMDTLPGSILLDNGGTSSAEIEAYIDKVIQLGAAGAVMIHDWHIQGTRDKVKYCADYLKAKEAQGLIDVVNNEALHKHQSSLFYRR